MAGCWLCEDIVEKGFVVLFWRRSAQGSPAFITPGGVFLVFIKRLRGIILLGLVSNGADGLAVQAELGMVAE